MLYFQVLLHDLHEIIRHSHEKSQSQVWQYTVYKYNSIILLFNVSLTLSLLMSYIYEAPCKARNFIVVHIWTYV
jgi:hypothetical protein